MTPSRRLVLPVLLLTLPLGLAGCGGDDAGGTGSAGAGKPPQSAPKTPSDAKLAARAAAGDDAPAGGATLVDAVDEPDASVSVGASGFDPTEVDVPVGSVVRFTTTGGTYSVLVGDLQGYTVTKGLEEYFRFAQPGTYKVREDVSGAAMTVTVD